MFRHVLIPISSNRRRQGGTTSTTTGTHTASTKPTPTQTQTQTQTQEVKLLPIQQIRIKREEEDERRTTTNPTTNNYQTIDDDDDDDDEMEEMSEFEKQRLANIRERDELLRKLRQEATIAGHGMDMFPSPRAQVGRSGTGSGVSTPRKRVKREGSGASTPVKREVGRPTRSSARLRGLKADDEVARERMEREAEERAAEERKGRVRVRGDLKVGDIEVGGTRWNAELRGLGVGVKTEDEEVDRIRREEEERERKPVGKEVAELRERFAGLRVWGEWEPNQIKITPERIYTIAFHPTEDKPVIFAGDKVGHLGIFDASQTRDVSDDDSLPLITTIKPHSRTISSIYIPPHDPRTVYTSSYDGSIRALDLSAQIATEVYAPSAEEDENGYVDDPLSGVEVAPEDDRVLYFSTLNGNFGRYDTRTPSSLRATRGSTAGRRSKAVITSLSEKKIGGFSFCRSAGAGANYFATGSLDRYMRVWDVRKLGEPVGEHLSALSVSHAAFNARGQVATAGYDNTVKVWDLAGPGVLPGRQQEEKVTTGQGGGTRTLYPDTVIRHNCQTGRWVTILRPAWQAAPRFLPGVQRFAIGDMSRYVDVFTAEGQSVCRLGGAQDGVSAVPASVAMHGSREWVVGGTASGRVCLWL